MHLRAARGVITCWTFFLVFFPPSPSSLASAKDTAVFEKIWTPFVVQKPLRHRFEGIEVENNAQGEPQSLILRLWFEPYIGADRKPNRDKLACQLAYNLIYGRARERSSASSVPLREIFDSYPSVQTVRGLFFVVQYRNQPADRGKAQSKSTTPLPRVVWSREERIFPYLSVTISRPEWKSMAAVLGFQENIDFPTFFDTLCPSILKLNPSISANFADLYSNSWKSEGDGGKVGRTYDGGPSRQDD